MKNVIACIFLQYFVVFIIYLKQLNKTFKIKLNSQK